MSSPEPEVLRENDLFAGVPLDTLAEVLKAGSHRRFPEGTVLIEEGDRSDGIYYLQEGTVHVLKGTESVELDRLEAGECFGEMSLFSREQTSARVVAETGIECYQFSRSTLDGFLRSDHEFALVFLKNIINRISGRLRDTNTELLALRQQVQSDNNST